MWSGAPASIEAVVTRHEVSIGVIATPAGAAQDVCDRLVAAGVTSILNFAPVVLSVPSGVDVRKVDLSIELQILAFHAQRRAVVRVGGEPDGGWAADHAGAAAGRTRVRLRRRLTCTAMDDDTEPEAQAIAT